MSSCNIRFLIVVLAIVFSVDLNSQNEFYDTESIREIHINFFDENWDHLLDSLYVEGENGRILADLAIDGETYPNVGVRYKGFSSVSVNNIKNPFNIKLDYVIEDQNHQGLDKLKLSNVIQDPSFVREVLSYEICRKYMPASGANFAKLYINEIFWGVYTNVEAVNNEFLIDGFGTKYSPFFKCNPDALNVQIGGENSNLSHSHGVEVSNYYPYYDIKSDEGWDELYHLIDTLNNEQQVISQVLNIDRSLWMHALNYSMINFDSYIGYGQNYYLYQDQAKQFNPIIWDLNMSFGGFRLTDASQLYYNGFDISQASTMDPLVHYNYASVSPRPLMTNLLQTARAQKMYLAHIRTIMEENFVNQEYFNRGSALQELIASDVADDINKFYSYEDFILNLTDQVSIVSSICPGITQLMDERSDYLSSYEGYSGEPEITNVTNVGEAEFFGTDLWITAFISDATYGEVTYRFGNNQRFISVEMFDDGNNNDGLADDGIYGCKIEGCSNSIDYYIYSENDVAGVFAPKRAAFEFYNIRSNISSGDLVINEVMSNNYSIASDPSGKFEDWIELYNTSEYPISTNGLFISDALDNVMKWDLPNHMIPVDGYYTVWADEDGNQGEDHANFKLSNLGEHLTLSNSDSTLIDSVTYITQDSDISYARSPNGVGGFTMRTPTFNFSNDASGVSSILNNVSDAYPNPFSDVLYVNYRENLVIQDFLGRVIVNVESEVVNTSSWPPGAYFMSSTDHLGKVYKLLKIK